MTVTGVTFRYQFGASVSEAGLNRISAGLRIRRPELFTQTKTLVVKPAPPGHPPSEAHELTVYAVINTPLAFNFYPITGRPDLREDTLLVNADISFSMTDSLLGTVTRIGVTVQAIAGVKVADGSVIVLNLVDFKLTEIRGEQPDPTVPAVAAPPLALVSGTDQDGDLGRTFRAIVTYVVELFVKDTLEKAITAFPVPPLDQLLNFGTLGRLPLQGLFIRNDALYVMTGNDLFVPTTFPGAPASMPDLRAGISQAGMERILDALLPIPVPVEAGHAGDCLHLTSQNLQVPRIDFRFNPPANSFPVRVHLSGLLNLRVNVPIPVFGGHLIFDIPFPIDKLTQYAGRLFPTILVEDLATKEDAKVRVRLAPDTGFLNDWYVLIVTDYRDFLADAFRDAVRRHRDQLLGKEFCKIPIIGWIVCGITDVTAEILGFLLGSVLDFFVSTILTTLVNTLGRAVLVFIDRPSFDVFSARQDELLKQLSLTIKSAAVSVVENGRDGDLQISLWADAQGLPVPPVPDPVVGLPGPTPPPIPDYPGAPELPEYDAAAFRPVTSLPTPTWIDGATQHFETKVTLSKHGTSAARTTVQFEKTTGRWRLHLSTEINGRTVSEAFAEYSELEIKPIRAEHIGHGDDMTLRQVVDFQTPGKAIASIGIDGADNLVREAILRETVPLDLEEFVYFRYAHAPLAAEAGSYFGRIETSDPHSAINWVREIPVAVTIRAGTVNQPPPDSPPGSASTDIPAWILHLQDEERETTCMIAQDGSGLLRLISISREGTVEMTRL